MLLALALVGPRAVDVLRDLRAGGAGLVLVVTAAVDLCADCVGPAR